MADTPPSEQPTQALTGGQVARATLVVMIGFILSRALGLVRESITAGLFGTGLAVDAFGAASRPPETIFLVVAGGAIGSAFIPTFMTYVADNKRDEAYRLTSTIINLLLIGMIVLCGVVAIFARPIAGLLVLGHADPAAQPLTADLLRIMLVTPAIYGVSGLMMGFLQAHQRFLLPALAPAFRNLGVIAGAVFLAPTMGIYGLAWGAVLGAGLHFLVQLPGIVATRYPYRPLLDLKHPGVRRVARLMGPRVIGLAIVQINFWVNTILAAGMAEGSIGVLNWAWFVMLLPQGVIAQSVATAVFPTFAAQVSEGKTADLRRTLVEVITRAFYALHDTRTPVLIGGGAMLLNVILSLSLIRVIGDPGDLARGAFAGLALANTLATTLEGVALLVLIGPRVGGMEWRRLGVGLLRTGAACAGMGLALWLALPLIERLGVWIGTLGGIALGGAIFWGLALLLGSEMARTFTDLALRRLRLYQAKR